MAEPPPAAARAIALHPADTVAIAVADLGAGETVETPHGAVILRDRIPQGHKLASKAMAADAPVTKYNQTIGFASVHIPEGAHVHTHNVEVRDFERHASGGPLATVQAPAGPVPTFQGYRRNDGRAGTRNYLLVLSTVNCSATVCRGIADAFRAHPVLGDPLADFPNVDGVVALTHDFGCIADPHLQRVIAGYARHPNVAGFLIVGLGCESNAVGAVAGNYGLPEGANARYLVIQDRGGTKKTIEEGIAIIRDMLPEANRWQREPIPASELILGLECGGSDAWSGVTANPALGRAADLLVGLGGSAVLAETPEIFGAEHLLIARAATPEIAKTLKERVAWWQDYAEKRGASLDNNPSAGNKAGGLTTILEKSLGAVAKGGTTPFGGVADYGAPITARGFSFMDTPGYDPSSVTGLIAGGANVICFTTGRGSAFGSKPVPTLKLATTTALYERMPDDMDINAGLILDGTETVETMGEIILDAVIAAASGTPTRSEENGYGDEEFAPWSVGAVL